MKGALASFARRRAISVLPTPVGPIIRMFLGVISLRKSSSSCMRRQRLRSAMATARLAFCWPTMCLSSSWTFSRGVISDMVYFRQWVRPSCGRRLEIQFFNGEVVVGVDTHVAGNAQAFFNDLPRAELGIFQQGASGGLREGTAGTDGNEVVFRLDHVTIAGD